MRGYINKNPGFIYKKPENLTKSCHYPYVVPGSHASEQANDPMLKLFTKYASIGVINTLIHWLFFAAMYYGGANQSLANFGAFCIAVTFSFFANARWTFNAQTTTFRYMIYVIFMGSMASFIGWIADKCNLSPIFTLIIFSAISLVCGFFYSKLIVFKGSK